MFLRRLLRVVESFEGRPGRASAWTESNVVFAAACLVRTFGAMRAEGEVSRLWVGWALGWCCLVGAVAAARMVEGAGVGPLLRLASVFDTARAHDTKAEAESAVRYLTAWLAREAYALPPAARSAALRVVAAFDDLVLGGVEAAPPGRASQVGASGPAGDPWFRYAPATAGGCCGTCGPECPAKSPGAGVEVWGLRYEQKGSALPSALVLYAVVPVGGGWALVEGEALGLPQPMENPADLLHAVCERNGWRCLGILAPAEVRAAESEVPEAGARAPKPDAPPVDPCAPRPAPLREAVSGGLVKLFGYWWRADGDDPAGPARFELVALELGDLKLWRLAFELVLGDAGEWGDPRGLVEGRAAARGHRVLSVVEPEQVEAVAPGLWWGAMVRAEEEIVAAGASKG